MTITKTQAAQMAAQMVATKRATIKKLDEQVSDIVRTAYMATLPKEVIEFADKYSDFFRETSCISLNGNGFNYNRIYIKSAPSKESCSFQYLTLSDNDASIVQFLIDEKDALKAETDKLELDIEATILALRTDKHIRENFPQAAEFLPTEKKPKTAVAINISDLQARLNS